MPNSSSSQSIFRTHLNYIRCVAMQYSGLVLSTSLRPTSPLPTTNIDRFQKLSDFTAKSIETELSASKISHEYATIMVSWLPVKCYYRLYYLESILIYLLNGNSTGFRKGGHQGVRKSISTLINNGELIFSNIGISTQSTIKMIRTHKIRSGENLMSTFYKTDDCVYAVRNKVSQYKEYDWKESKNIKNYRTAKSRGSRDNYYATTTINLTDFFYWLRIKVNYKDLDFLDFPDAGSPEDALIYVENYIKACQSYSKALINLTQKIENMRNM